MSSGGGDWCPGCLSMFSWLRGLASCITQPEGTQADDVSLLREGSTPNFSSNLDQMQHRQASYIPAEVLPGGGAPLYYPSPNVSRPVSQLTEEEQIKVASRLGLIQHLPMGTFDGCKKYKECVICMGEFCIGDEVRYLPCMHTYHVQCIDDWLMRSFTCPSCMEPVDAALLVAFDSN